MELHNFGIERLLHAKESRQRYADHRDVENVEKRDVIRQSTYEVDQQGQRDHRILRIYDPQTRLDHVPERARLPENLVEAADARICVEHKSAGDPVELC